MNKTFLLKGIASYTEASMLIVIDSIEEFRRLFIEYHNKKYDALHNLDYFIHQDWKGDRWWDAVKEKDTRFKEFMESNKSGYHFEISTGTNPRKYPESEFYLDISILKEEDPYRGDYWVIEREFMSDLPKGTHYYGDYCA